MCSGRSAEELSSARKALTFAKGPCNKATNSQRVNPDVGDVRALGCRQGWDRSTGLVMIQECPGKECYTAGLKWWRQSGRDRLLLAGN